MNMLFDPETATARAIVSSISSAVLLFSMMLAGAAPPNAVTVLVSRSKAIDLGGDLHDRRHHGLGTRAHLRVRDADDRMRDVHRRQSGLAETRGDDAVQGPEFFRDDGRGRNAALLE